MTQPPTTSPDVGPVTLDTTREQRFIRRLAAGHAAGTLGPLHRWHPGQIDPQVIAFTQDATRIEYIPWALTAKAFALFHSTRREVRYGYPGDGIGRWARRANTNPQTIERLLTALARAQDPLNLDRQLTALARMNIASARFAPHWETVQTELVRWADPTTRNDIRFTWSRDFHTYTPHKPAAGS